MTSNMICHSLGNQKLIPHNGHKNTQRIDGGRGLRLLGKVQNHIICTIQLNHNHSHILVSQSEPNAQIKRVVCDHCALVSSTYLTNNSSSFRTPSNPGLTLSLALRTNTPCRNSPFASRLLLNSTFGYDPVFL